MEETYADRIWEFFSAYQARFQQALDGHNDIEGTARAFADCFIAASPAGVNCGTNDEEFRKAIPQGNEFYRGIGTKEMCVTSIKSSRLDDRHYMAKVAWHSVYEKKDGTSVMIDFSVIYLLQDMNGVLKIFAYITGDEQAELKKHGVI